LQCHPDKNLENAAEAAEKFKEVQAAYAILSDAQERAWYDSHRESILRDGAGASKDDDDDSPSTTTKKLLRFFDTGCYDGFSDSAGDFYEVYRNLFERLDEEEELEELTNTYHTKAASFGGAHVPPPDSIATDVT
jgi:DnaJ family protein A protein 5